MATGLPAEFSVLSKKQLATKPAKKAGDAKPPSILKVNRTFRGRAITSTVRAGKSNLPKKLKLNF
jgi:hypothetical protein